MRQVSDSIYCSEFLYGLRITSTLLNKAYSEYPFLIIDDFLSKDECQSVLDHIKNTNEFEKAKLKTIIAIDTIKPKVDQNIRKTDIYTLTFAQNEHFGLRFDTFRAQIEKFFNVSLLNASDTQVLSYNKDSFYSRHSDDSSEVVDQRGKAVDYKLIAPHRVITTVLFLNNGGEDFCGGELVFSHLSDIDGVPFCYKPKQGFMVIFPSNPYFAHEILKVTSGHRATLVNWHDAIVH